MGKIECVWIERERERGREGERHLQEIKIDDTHVIQSQ
jgi:hypothetical protein